MLLTIRPIRHARRFSIVLTVPLLLSGCIGTPPGSNRSSVRRQFPLDQLDTAIVTIDGHIFRVWLARTEDQRREGLMFVSEDEIDDDQGMLFLFDREQPLSFWMKNTIISLDVAFARSDGTIVTIHTMPPLTTNLFASIEPAMFALEVKGGTFRQLNIHEGDRIQIPPSVFKP